MHAYEATLSLTLNNYVTQQPVRVTLEAECICGSDCSLSLLPLVSLLSSCCNINPHFTILFYFFLFFSVY